MASIRINIWKGVIRSMFFRCVWWLLWKQGNMCEGLSRPAILSLCWIIYWTSLWRQVGIRLHRWRNCSYCYFPHHHCSVCLDDLCQVNFECYKSWSTTLLSRILNQNFWWSLKMISCWGTINRLLQKYF